MEVLLLEAYAEQEVSKVQQQRIYSTFDEVCYEAMVQISASKSLRS